MNDLNELREVSRLGRIKIGLATIGMSIIGLIMAFVTAITSLIGGIAVIFGGYKLVGLSDKIINNVLETISYNAEKIFDKIMEDEE